jgi:hypothetical protein
VNISSPLAALAANGARIQDVVGAILASEARTDAVLERLDASEARAAASAARTDAVLERLDASEARADGMQAQMDAVEAENKALRVNLTLAEQQTKPRAVFDANNVFVGVNHAGTFLGDLQYDGTASA